MDMRQDARALLVKLSQQDFNYRQFEDQYADMELWPIFEALLKDERISGPEMTPMERRQAERQTQSRQVPHKPADAGGHAGGLFEAYEAEAPKKETPPAATGDDLRNFLKRLGQ